MLHRLVMVVTSDEVGDNWHVLENAKSISAKV